MLDIGFAELLVIAPALCGWARTTPKCYTFYLVMVGTRASWLRGNQIRCEPRVAQRRGNAALKESRDEVQDLTDVSSMSLLTMMKRAINHFTRMGLTVALPDWNQAQPYHHRLMQTTRPQKLLVQRALNRVLPRERVPLRKEPDLDEY